MTILDNPPDQARIVREEQFGPIIPLMVFDNVEDAILRANDSEYGLAASVWSADLAKATEIGERLEVGTVWINETQYMTPLAAFGGHKQSGVGTENGVEGLLEYTLPKTIVVNKDPL